MTQQEFDNTGFYKGMQVSYDGCEYWVRSVNFRERLLGLLPSFLSVDDAASADDYEIDWVRCENCEVMIVEPNPERSVATDDQSRR